MSKEVRILSTRQLDEAIVRQAAEERILIDTIPFIETRDTTNDAMGAAVNALGEEPVFVVFTSRNSVEAVARLLNRPVYWRIACMGGATLKAAIDFFGEQAVLIAAGNAKELAERIIETGSIQSVVFFAGNRRLDELPDTLHQAGIGVKELVVYETINTPQAINTVYEGVIFFSPSAAESFFSMNGLPATSVIFTIGTTTAAAVGKFVTNKVISSDIHSQEKLLQKIIAYYRA